MNKTEPKILLLDIETMPDMGEVMKVMTSLSNHYGLTLKASINSIICFGYKIFGEDEIKCVNAWDFKTWNKNINDDKEVCLKIQQIMEDIDCVVTHNGKRFDWKFIQTRFLKHGLTPLRSIPHIDTCSEAKKNLFLFNNRLNTVAKHLSVDEKLENGGWDLWVKVSQRDKDAMKLMEQYCKQDINVLDQVFKKLRPLIKNIPNYGIFSDLSRPMCPSCGGTKVEKKGFMITKTGTRQRYRCLHCGSNSSKPVNSELLR